MSQRVTCPSCSKTLAAPPGSAGKVGKCPHCQTRISFPPDPPSLDPLEGLDQAIRDEAREKLQFTAPVAPAIDVAPTIRNSPPPISTRPTFFRYVYELNPSNVFWVTFAFLSACTVFSIVAMIVFLLFSAVLTGIATGVSELGRK